MKSKVFLLLAVITLNACSFNSKPKYGLETTSVRHVRPFNRIEIKGACDVKFTQGDKFEVKVVGAEQLVDLLSTQFKGETLAINVKEPSKIVRWSRGYESPVVYVTSPDLIGIHMEGAGDFEVAGIVDTDTLNVFLKGMGDVELSNVICDEFHTTLLGMGDVDVKSLTAQHSSIHLKGVGDVDVHFVNSGSASCTLEGVGDIKLSGALKRLQKTIRGTGDIDTDALTLNHK